MFWLNAGWQSRMDQAWFFTVPPFSHPHSPSIYSGATVPKPKPSPRGRSRQQSLPLLQLHLNYSLLSRQLHTNHCYLGSLATEQRPATLLPALNCSVRPFPSPLHLNCIDLKSPAQSRGWQTSRRTAGNKAPCAHNTSVCCHSSPCQLNSFEPTVE